MNRARWIRYAIVFVLVALLVGRWLADHTAERLWAASVGVGEAHAGIAALRLMLLALAFCAATLWCVGNVYLFYRSIGSVHVPRRVGNIEFLEAVPRRYLLLGALVIGLLLAVVVSHDAGDWWTVQTLLDEPASIGTRDPILGQDLGYYLFVLPWYRTLHSFATLLSGTMLAVVTLLYAGVGAIRWTRRRLHVSELARMHLAGLFAAFALALFWGYRLEPAEYVAGIHGVALDATLVEVRIPVARLLSVLGLLAAGVSFAWLWIPSVGMMTGVWTVLAVVSIVGHHALPVFTSSVRETDRMTPPEIDRAAAELERVAYGLERHDSTPTTLASQDGRTLALHRPQLRASPIWDPFAITATSNVVRPNQPEAYTRFGEASLALYRGSRGQVVPVYLAAREVDLARARDAGVLTWESEHTTPYGHTGGVIAVAAHDAAEDGSPLFLTSLEPADSVSTRFTEIRQPEPGTFFSPVAGDFSIVTASPGEYVGVPAGGFARRIALAWALQSPRLLSSELLSPEVLILWERQIAPRLDRYAPFARFGAAYPVFANGRLWWISNGYVSAETFPLVRGIRWRGETARYLRAGFIGVVDARSGATFVYLSAAPDPLSTAWARHASDLVRPFSDLAPALAEHLRYPEELFDVQVALIRGPIIAAAAATATPAPAGSAPRTPRPNPVEQARRRPIWWAGPWGRDTTTRLRILARFESDDSNTIAGLIEGALVRGAPSLEVTRLQQSVELSSPAEIAKRLAEDRAPAVGVSGVRRTILLSDGLLGVQSSYATGEGAPRLADLIIQWGPIAARGRTLEAALDKAVANAADGTVGADWTTARRWFDRMEQARQRGDWTAFGRAYDALRRLLSGQ